MSTFTRNNPNRNPIEAKKGFSVEELAQGKGGGISVDSQSNSSSVEAQNRPYFVDYVAAYVDADGSTNRYYGFLDINGAYFIQHESISAGVSTYKYSVGTGGNSALTTAWTGRAGLTYYFIDEVTF